MGSDQLAKSNTMHLKVKFRCKTKCHRFERFYQGTKAELTTSKNFISCVYNTRGSGGRKLQGLRAPL